MSASIVVRDLSKRFGRNVLAVDGLSFEVKPGRVTGFLGPNGSGKTTTLRCLLSLVRPTSGETFINGTPYRQLHQPGRIVGAVLEASSFHPGRKARDHLRFLCAAASLPDSRVDECLAAVGLTESANRRVGGFSLGMRQRLALAAALLGDPRILILDEPANGLDPEGIAWLRVFVRAFAAEGKTVLLSSHVLSEMQQTVDDVVIISNGALARACSLADLAESAKGRLVRVRTPQRDAFLAALAGQVPVTNIEREGSDVIRISDTDGATIGRLAHRAGIELHELTPEHSDLETVFLKLTSGDA